MLNAILKLISETELVAKYYNYVTEIKISNTLIKYVLFNE